MAQRTQVLLTCDVHDGDAEAAQTVTYTVEGQTYECELCQGHLAEFREAMEIWSSHSRLAGRGRSGPSSIPPAAAAGAAGPGPSRGATARRRPMCATGPGPRACRSAPVAASRPSCTRPTPPPTEPQPRPTSSPQSVST